MDMRSFSFQGSVFFAQRDANGDALAFRNVGSTPTFDLQLGVETDQQRETESGRRLLASEIVTAQNANISAVLNHFSTQNLALGLYSTPAVIASGSESGETLPDNLEVGDFVALQQPNVSALALEDDAAASLTEGTNYRIESAGHGMIEILDLASLTQPFVANYDTGGGINLALFTQPPPERWVRLNGINTADNDKPVIVDLYRVKWNPFETLSLINEAHGNLPLNGVALYDETKAGDPSLGQFGRIIDASQPQS